MWKKLTVTLSAPVAVIAVVKLFNATTWGFLPFVALVVGAAAVAVWATAKLLGVRLSLRSWD